MKQDVYDKWCGRCIFLYTLFFLVIIIVGLCLLSSCAAPKEVIKWRTEYKDSVRVKVHERLVRDTVSVEIPVIIEKNVTEADSSHLENKFAKSDAVIRNGKLFHSLETKPQTFDVPVDIPVADTTTTHVSSALEQKDETKYVEVEKELSWIQKTSIYGFWCMVLFALLYFGWKYRRWILAIVRRFI